MKYYKSLSNEEKTQHTRLALGMAGVCANDNASEIIWRTFEAMYSKGASFSLKDSCEIEIKVKGELTPKNIKFEKPEKE